MSLELVPATSEHVAEISRIAYEGFRQVSSRHGFPSDFPNAEGARPVYDLLVRRNDYFGLVALVDNRPVGSNFIMKSDHVAAVGPLSVDPRVQGQGIGRLLMTSLLAHAAVRNFNEVRLLADSHNVAAVSLYSSLGFEVRDVVALIHTSPSPTRDKSVRRISDRDLPTVRRLSQTLYSTSRYNEIVNSSKYGFATYLREKDGRATGYLMPGLVGHSAAETEDDTIALLSETARCVPDAFRKFLCPMSQSILLQRSMQSCWKVEKLLTYMTLGPYKSPDGIWTPSACY